MPIDVIISIPDEAMGPVRDALKQVFPETAGIPVDQAAKQVIFEAWNGIIAEGLTKMALQQAASNVTIPIINTNDGGHVSPPQLP